VFLVSASVKGAWAIQHTHSTLATVCRARECMAKCACGCGAGVEQVGHYRKGCRLRILAAGGVCPRNEASAARKAYNLKHNPAKSLINNPKNSAKNNAKASKKRKLALRAANLQAVIDDPTLNQTLKMSPGTSASVSDCTHKTHLFTQRHLTHCHTELTDIDDGGDDRGNYPDCGAHLQQRAQPGWHVHRGQASLQLGHDPHSPEERRHIQAPHFHVVPGHHHQEEKTGELLAHSISGLEAINLCVCVQLNADMDGKS